MEQQIIDAIEQRREEIYAFLEDLVDTNSFTSNREGIIAVADKIIRKAADYGIEFRKVHPLQDRGFPVHLLYDRYEGEDFYGIIGHFDTVHPPQGPFQKMRVSGEKLVGPGVNDMKGGIVVGLFSVIILRMLKVADELPVRILFNSDEEIGSKTSRDLIREQFRDARGAFVFEAGRVPGNNILTARKGAMELIIDVKGKAAHVGESPGKGINAITEMVSKLYRLNKLNDQENGISIHAGLIEGGVARNVVAPGCRAKVDIRFTDAEAGRRLVEEIKSVLATPELQGAGIDYTLEVHRPPFCKSGESERLKNLYFETAEAFGYTVGETQSGGVSDGNVTSGMGVATLDGLGPVGALPHTENEYIIAESLMDRTKIFSVFFYKLISQQGRS